MTDYAFAAIIFDCDGVLVDTERLSNRVWKRMLAELDLHLEESELHYHFTGRTTADNLITAARLLDRPLAEDFHDRLREGFRREVEVEMPVIPGISEALAAIALPKATATNALGKDLRIKLQRTGLITHFNHLVSVDDVPRPKPAPDIYLAAAALLNVSPEKCAVVEDSPTGIRAAKAAGMTVYGYSAEFPAELQIEAGADHTFDDMRQLNALLRRLPRL